MVSLRFLQTGHHKFTADNRNKARIPAALRAQWTLHTEFLADAVKRLDRPGGMDPAHLSQAGARAQRREIAAKLLQRLDGDYAPLVAQAEADAVGYGHQVDAAVEAKLSAASPLAVERARATLAWLGGLAADDPAREDFVRQALAGHPGAVLACLIAPEFGPHAHLGRIARDAVVKSLPDRADAVYGVTVRAREQVPASDIAAKIVRQQFAVVRAEIAKIAATGDYSADGSIDSASPAELGALGNTFEPLRLRAAELGVCEPSASAQAVAEQHARENEIARQRLEADGVA